MKPVVERRLPPARIVVELGHLDEAELLVVVGANPLGRVDGALLERGIDVAARDLLRHNAEALHDLAGKAPEPELQTLEIVDLDDLVAEPAAHLAVGVAGGNEVRIVALEKLVQEILPAAVEEPGVLHARVHAERQRRAEHERVVLAEVIVERSVAAFDRAALDRVEHLQARNDLAGGEDLDLELVVGQRRDALRDVLGAAIERIERLRPAGRHAPLDLGHRLRNRRGGDGRRCGTDAGDSHALEEFAPCNFSHSTSPWSCEDFPRPF